MELVKVGKRVFNLDHATWIDLDAEVQCTVDGVYGYHRRGDVNIEFGGGADDPSFLLKGDEAARFRAYLIGKATNLDEAAAEVS